MQLAPQFIYDGGFVGWIGPSATNIASASQLATDGQSVPAHGRITQIVGKSAENGGLNHDLANPSYNALRPSGVVKTAHLVTSSIKKCLVASTQFLAVRFYCIANPYFLPDP